MMMMKPLQERLPFGRSIFILMMSLFLLDRTSTSAAASSPSDHDQTASSPGRAGPDHLQSVGEVQKLSSDLGQLPDLLIINPTFAPPTASKQQREEPDSTRREVLLRTLQLQQQPSQNWQQHSTVPRAKPIPPKLAKPNIADEGKQQRNRELNVQTTSSSSGAEDAPERRLVSGTTIDDGIEKQRPAEEVNNEKNKDNKYQKELQRGLQKVKTALAKQAKLAQNGGSDILRPLLLPVKGDRRSSPQAPSTLGQAEDSLNASPQATSASPLSIKIRPVPKQKAAQRAKTAATSNIYGQYGQPLQHTQPLTQQQQFASRSQPMQQPLQQEGGTYSVTQPQYQQQPPQYGDDGQQQYQQLTATYQQQPQLANNQYQQQLANNQYQQQQQPQQLAQYQHLPQLQHPQQQHQWYSKQQQPVTVSTGPRRLYFYYTPSTTVVNSDFTFAPHSPGFACFYGFPIPQYNTPRKKCIPNSPLCGWEFTCVMDVHARDENGQEVADWWTLNVDENGFVQQQQQQQRNGASGRGGSSAAGGAWNNNSNGISNYGNV